MLNGRRIRCPECSGAAAGLVEAPVQDGVARKPARHMLRLLLSDKQATSRR
jgi:hypothetical protein